MNYTIGSLVNVRGRDWIVQHGSSNELLLLKPIGGAESDLTGLYPSLEDVKPAEFPKPVVSQLGDYHSAQLLRDALRIGFRHTSGPFRSFGQIAVSPRPYQLVPLMMGLKLDPVRLLIADDVGIGKTIEAALLARELLDRGEISRMAILCPPHLADQWQRELKDKFHIDAELVLPSTVSRLERRCAQNETVFDIYPFVIVSLDFIKSDRRRDDFLRTCPEFVIVDEAHTCTESGDGIGARQQRHRLMKGLAADPDRHIVLVTATPHSGNEAAFRSLIQLLNERFSRLPDEAVVAQDKRWRDELAKHVVQRRRGDIVHYLKEQSESAVFALRKETEESYKLSPSYRSFVDLVIEYARETVQAGQDGLTQYQQRVQWWSVLGLLRAIASSPRAAAETLRTRALRIGGNDNVFAGVPVEHIDEWGRQTVLDDDIEDVNNNTDDNPGADWTDSNDSHDRSRLLQMAETAAQLEGTEDTKLSRLLGMVEKLVEDGFQPIVFCRFIATAHYLNEQLHSRFKTSIADNKLVINAVTGELTPHERESLIHDMYSCAQRILVATDCISEGINLQSGFDTVIHYDLSWNPTRHEQREGRVDRFGQVSPEVRVITYYAQDNLIDGIVLNVLIRKHKAIRNALGVSVAVPSDTNQVVEAMFESMLRKQASQQETYEQLTLTFDDVADLQQDLFNKWDDATAKQRRSRTIFAQETIRTEEVAEQLAVVQAVIGKQAEWQRFLCDTLRWYGATVRQNNGIIDCDLTELPVLLKSVFGGNNKLAFTFDIRLAGKAEYVTRTHPFLSRLSEYALDQAISENGIRQLPRIGVVRSDRVHTVTALAIVRNRYQLTYTSRKGNSSANRSLFVEDCSIEAFKRKEDQWVPATETSTDDLLSVLPAGNVPDSFKRSQVEHFLGHYSAEIEPHLMTCAMQSAEKLADEHQRVRQHARMTGKVSVEPHLPPDLLAFYIFIPTSREVPREQSPSHPYRRQPAII